MPAEEKAVIALLGQPNSGKSSLFNVLTGSHQHVGNWPGKTVAQKEGTFTHQGNTYRVADLPGSYSLTAKSEEEMITQQYIQQKSADLICIFADASQLQRSLYMLADYAGNTLPAVLILNMMDVAEAQGISIDTKLLEERLGIPVIPFVAIDRKSYTLFYERMEEALRDCPVLQKEAMKDASARYQWIETLLDGVVKDQRQDQQVFSRFDRLATSRRFGKWIALGIILVIFIAAMMISGVFCMVGMVFSNVIGPALRSIFVAGGVHPVLISIVCDVMMNVMYFVLMMSGFVLGVTFGFNVLEEVGYIARVSFLFDHAMSRLGLQGKAILPFFMGMGCTIGGATGTRVIDNWGQRILTISLAWAVPCAATWSVVPALASTFFGPVGGMLIVLAIIVFMFCIMMLTAKIFGQQLVPDEERAGMIMELPPYHKPHIKNIAQVTLRSTADIFQRAFSVITVVSIVFFLLSYSGSGNASDTILYRVGVTIEPVTKFFGLSWQTFMAFLSSMISKESLLGVLNSLYTTGTGLVGSTFGAKVAGSGTDVGTLLAQNISRPEALAFIFAITFNMPCVNALAATAREAGSWRWTAKIGAYYTCVSLALSCVVYHIGLLIW